MHSCGQSVAEQQPGYTPGVAARRQTVNQAGGDNCAAGKFTLKFPVSQTAGKLEDFNDAMRQKKKNSFKDNKLMIFTALSEI